MYQLNDCRDENSLASQTLPFVLLASIKINVNQAKINGCHPNAMKYSKGLFLYQVTL
jgi:hypothetical protein